MQKRSDNQSGPATLAAVSHDDIARLAYDIFDKNGRQQGQCQQNWQQAEQELKEGQSSCAEHEDCCEKSPAQSAMASPAMKAAVPTLPARSGGKVQAR
ncbi:MAG: DUF2934 domain-containing protein [Woeseiaceae bacterium]|nr:DUF2934 domain-containing protein [Woeseiaceae bacterium]